MIRPYKKINHRIFEIQNLLEFLVLEVFCKADKQKCFTKLKLNDKLKILYENNRSNWFKDSVENIYLECKSLTIEEKNVFKELFLNNNNIEFLCSNPNEKLPLTILKIELANVVIPFFKELYDKLLEWKDIFSDYGTKKEYYDDLIWENGNDTNCPCCGYGIIKTVYDKGHSPYDHYLPLKHYPFSVVNFNNLFPFCTHCNSDAKGEKDILKENKKVFYPFNEKYPIIFNLEIDTKSLSKFIYQIKEKEKRINVNELIIEIKCDTKYKEEIESWDFIFDIRSRYFAQVSSHALEWINDVREKHRKDLSSFENAFDTIIKDDSNKRLGFLKSPFLTKLKSYSSLIEAMDEVFISSKIDVTKPIT